MNLQLFMLSLVSGYIIDQDLQLAYGSETRILQTMKEVSNVYGDFNHLQWFLGTLSYRMNRLVKEYEVRPQRRIQRISRK